MYISDLNCNQRVINIIRKARKNARFEIHYRTHGIYSHVVTAEKTDVKKNGDKVFFDGGDHVPAWLNDTPIMIEYETIIYGKDAGKHIVALYDFPA